MHISSRSPSDCSIYFLYFAFACAGNATADVKSKMKMKFTSLRFTGTTPRSGLGYYPTWTNTRRTHCLLILSAAPTREIRHLKACID